MTHRTDDRPIPSVFNLSALIEALTIICKYSNEEFPTNCQHDVLFVSGPAPKDMDPKDAARLKELGFIWPAGDDEEDYDGDYECGWITFRFGSC